MTKEQALGLFVLILGATLLIKSDIPFPYPDRSLWVGIVYMGVGGLVMLIAGK